jgi:hypothetical protein
MTPTDEARVEALALCQICGEPMPEGEDVFNYHGLSAPCPKPPIKRKLERVQEMSDAIRNSGFDVGLLTPEEVAKVCIAADPLTKRYDELTAEHVQLKADVVEVLRDARRYVSADADEYETTPPLLAKLDALLDRLDGGVT